MEFSIDLKENQELPIIWPFESIWQRIFEWENPWKNNHAKTAFFKAGNSKYDIENENHQNSFNLCNVSVIWKRIKNYQWFDHLRVFHNGFVSEKIQEK